MNMESYTYIHAKKTRIMCIFIGTCMCIRGFPGGTSGKEPACQGRRARDAGSAPKPGRSPGGGHGSPPQYSCLENPMERGAWRAAVHGVTKSRTRLKCVITICGPSFPAWPREQSRVLSPNSTGGDRKSTRLNSSHTLASRMPSSA